MSGFVFKIACVSFTCVLCGIRFETWILFNLALMCLVKISPVQFHHRWPNGVAASMTTRRTTRVTVTAMARGGRNGPAAACPRASRARRPARAAATTRTARRRRVLPRHPHHRRLKSTDRFATKKVSCVVVALFCMYFGNNRQYVFVIVL